MVVLQFQRLDLRIQAAQFGGGFVCHRADRVKRGSPRVFSNRHSQCDGDGLKPLDQRHLLCFGLRTHGFTSLIASIASCA
jgi:hypothetical protein